ncbi:MAG: CoB--CoM heterodisulfide reductase iron-sulfur subunit B family protein [Candidatus Poseidoniales archaeon]|jgi:succinate dehydrogenase / fumarate reductase cytochrome b subunit|tara:strand:- start:16478 stop:17338 length:861 start_codon:yes stop_codon:yes gene_type:complete
MPLKYAYHPGNVSHSSAPEVKDTMFPIAKTLGIDLTIMEGATSCGAGIIRQVNNRLQLTLNARTFAMAESLGLDILTPCAATAGNLNEDLQTLLKDSILLAEINSILAKTCGLEFKGGVKVHHLLHVLVEEVGLDKIESKVKNPLNFKIAGYYGPNMQQSGMCGEDDAFDPSYLEDLIQAIGGNAVSWDSRTQSVGTPGLLSEEPTVLRQSANVILDAKDEGAEIIVSACNLSHTILDVYQGKASRFSERPINIPIIHMTEMIDFAFGHHNTRLAQLRTRIAVIGN